MALRCVAVQAAAVLRLGGRQPISQSFWVPLSRRFSQAVEETEVVLDGLHYAKSHEWVKVEGETATVGITDHAQKELGDVVFVDLPEPGKKFTQGETFGVVESVKAASDVYSPVSGEVVEVNGVLTDTPGLVNQGPYSDGWIMKLKLSDKGELDSLLDPAKYKEHSSAGH